MFIFFEIISRVDGLVSSFSGGLELEVQSNEFSREKLIEDIANDLSVTLSWIIKKNTSRMLLAPMFPYNFTPYPARSVNNFSQAESGDDQSIKVLVYMANLSFFLSGLERAMIQ